ncbi:hypothetical protein BWI97_01705 [Siphonobacter sp. BAB-5405]|uniref:hypothetical protein n=1 Tax=Siphonobacter sp. BAB-5405 TaxID=1864825 RepID=UPI000C80ACB1|nr:hypothetical protein [Siphonobacter sp. BAB-5405]PMD99147.1 hypothetical protein BWI97_01705 [Siphonobacter sp. BAB-5405]
MKQFFLFFTLLVFTIACKSTKNDPEPVIPEDVEYIDLDIDGKKTKWLTSDTTVFVTRIKRYAHYGDELEPIIGFTFEFRHKPYSGAPLKEYEKITLNFNKKLILEKPVRSNELMCQYTKSGVFENYFNLFPRKPINSNFYQKLEEGNFDVSTSRYNPVPTASDHYEVLASASDGCNFELSQEGSQVTISSVKPYTDRKGQKGWMIEATFKIRLYNPNTWHENAAFKTGNGKFKAFMTECHN